MEEMVKELGMTVLYMLPVIFFVLLWLSMSQSGGMLNGIIVSYFCGLTG